MTVDPDDLVREHYEAQDLPPEKLEELLALRPEPKRGRGWGLWAGGALAAVALLSVGGVLTLGASSVFMLKREAPTMASAPDPAAVADTGSRSGREYHGEGSRSEQPVRDEVMASNPLLIGLIGTRGEGEGVTDQTLGDDGDGDRVRLEALGYSDDSNEPTKTLEQNPVVAVPPVAFLATEQHPYSTFAADVDSASWTRARDLLRSGQRPAADQVRPEEFINAMPYDYPSPSVGNFGVTTEVISHGVAANVHVVRVGVQAKRMSVFERPPLNLTFLVDVSGSMNSEQKLGLVTKSLTHLVSQLGPEDSVALVTYAGRSTVLLGNTRANWDGKREIEVAIRSLVSGGSTAMGGGIHAAYEEAAKHHRDGVVSRVIVASDGDANVGNRRGEDIASTIRKYADEGIALTTLSVGVTSDRNHTMEMLANKGDGQHFFIGNARDGEKVLSERLVSNLVTLARDVKLQVEWDSQAVTEYRLIGYDNRRLADRDFRRDKVDAGEVGPDHQVTALYAVKLHPRHPADKALGVLRMRAKPPGPDAPAVETAFVLHGPTAPTASEAGADSVVALAAASLAEHLRGRELLPLSRAEELLEGAVNPEYPEHAELLEAIRRANQDSEDGNMPPPPHNSGVVTVQTNSSHDHIEVLCDDNRKRAVIRGGMVVVSGMEGGACRAVLKGATPVAFEVELGASYSCSGEPLLCRRVR